MMGRCNHGERSEVCKCLELFKLYISTNPHQGRVSDSTTPENMRKLFRGLTSAERRKVLREIHVLIERFREELNKYYLDADGVPKNPNKGSRETDDGE